MARRANTTLIGLFIVGALILGVSATLLFGSGMLRDKSHVVMFFNGSVKGLSVGAPVNFRGVKIGTVTDIRLRLDPGTQEVKIPVYVELEPNRISFMSGKEMDNLKTDRLRDMINNGLRAQLEMQSLLTGQFAIQLDMRPDKPAILVGVNENIIEIPTIPTPIQELARKLEEFPIDELLENLANAAAGADKLFNGPELPQAIRQFDQTMQDYSALTNQYNTLAQQLNQRSELISTDLNITLRDVRTTLQATQALADSSAVLMGNADELIQQLRLNADQVTHSTTATLAAIKATSDSANQLLADESPFQHQLSQTLQEIASSARALRILANTLEENPESLLRGKPEEGDH